MKKLKYLNALLVFVIWLSLTGFAPATQGSFATTNAIVLAAPASFNKVSPQNGAANQPAMGVPLSWNTSAGATYYAYCINARPNCPGNVKKWNIVGTQTSVTTVALTPNTVYYWQVRAYDNNNNFTEANGGTWWRFKTQPVLGNFGKISPANPSYNQPLSSLVLQWGASANATGYQYCLYTGTTNPCGTLNWTPVGNITQATVYNLQPNATYQWQVRAVNGTGTLNADNGSWWTFTTTINMPSAFNKLSPQNGASNQPIDLHLSWSQSAGADGYQYCIDIDTACVSGWKSVDASVTSIVPSPVLAYDTQYVWQVRAHNSQGYTDANGGTWWSFKTIIAAPVSFSKITPDDGTAHQLVNPWLYWSDSAGADHYELCWTQSIVSTCDKTWVPVGLTNAYQLQALTNDATYYWQVRAVNTTGTVEANSGEMWHFTTMQAPPTSSDQTFSIPEDTPLVSHLVATDLDPNANLVFSIYEQEAAGDLTLNQDGSFTYQPPLNYNGPMTFLFMVSDGYNAPIGPYSATITVTGVNDPPVLTTLPDVTAQSGDVISFTVTATDPDIPYGDQLTFLTPTNLPAGATFDPTSGSFIWNPLWSATQSNNYAITFVVKDQANATDQQTVHITVNPMKITLSIIRR